MSKRIKYILSVGSVIAQLVEKIDDEETVLLEKVFNVEDIPAILSDGDNEDKSLVAYGLSKILQDRTSSSKNEEKLDEMDDVFDLLKKGEWRNRKEGGVKKVAIDPIFAQAIAEIKGCSVAQATVALQGKTGEERKALKALDVVAEAIARIREEAEEDAEGLLDDLVA